MEAMEEKCIRLADCSASTRWTVCRSQNFSQCQSRLCLVCLVEVEILLDTTRHAVLEEIPVIHFDAALGVQHYQDVNEKRTARAHAIGPASFGESAITPTENPQNQKEDPKTGKKIVGTGSSHHIIEMRYSSQTHDPSLAVQLLINDVNGYITAKRVRKNNVWGGWQQFTDIDGVEAPEFLNAQVVDLPASKNLSMTIGGSMESMFYGLVGPVQNKKVAMLALQRAILLFCEAFRLRSIYLEMIRRILHKEIESKLSSHAWNRIGSWKVLSSFLIELGKYGRRRHAALTARLVSYAELYGLSTIEQVIEEVQVLLYSDDFLLTDSVKKKLAHSKAGLDIQDPMFP